MKRKPRRLKAAFPFYARENTCEGKVAYLTRAAAKAAMIVQKHGPKQRKSLNFYRCPWCPGWHIGNREGWWSRGKKR